MPARGSGKFGPDVIVGSKEYWRLWRESNKDRMKLAQASYRLRQKELEVASELAAGRATQTGEPVDFETALQEVRDKADAIRAVRIEQIAMGIAPVKDKVELIELEAEINNVTYEAAEKIMTSPDYKGDETWQLLSGLSSEDWEIWHGKRLLEILEKQKAEKDAE